MGSAEEDFFFFCNVIIGCHDVDRGKRGGRGSGIVDKVFVVVVFLKPF